MEKVVLAFSGGLDTSFCVPYLKNKKKLEVHTVMVNTGGFNKEEEKNIEERALKLGAKTHTTIEAVDTYYKKGIKYLIFGNILKNETYPLSVSSERIFQALEVLKLVKKIKAEYVAHGSTGAGNDQVRFDLVFDVLAAEVKILAPIRELEIGRKDEVDYLTEQGFNYSWEKAKYSINQGIWGTSIGGQETLNSEGYLPEEAYPHKAVKREEKKIKIDFKNGEPIALNGEKMAPVALIKEVTNIEAAAPLIIIKAHHLLEKHVLTKTQLYWKGLIAEYYGQLMHEAQYLEPAMRDMETFLESTQNSVSGSVEILLRPYSFMILGCKTNFDLMSSKFGEYGEVNKSYSGRDVIGFTKVLANPLKIYYSLHNQKEK